MLKRFFKLEFKPSDLKKPTVVILILSNLVPLYGVLFLRWEVFPILLLFWTENVMIGVFNVLKIIACKPASPLMWVGKIFAVPFFSFHYGIFALVHGIFIYILFGGLVATGAEIPDLKATIVWQMIKDYGLIWGFLCLLISHGISFVMNYILKGEYKESNFYDLMWEPYNRVLVLHLTIIFGGFILIYMGSPTGGLILLLVLKMAIDALAHLKLHAGNAPAVTKSGFAAS